MSEPSQIDDAEPFKEWLTATEILEADLPGLPHSERSLRRYLKEMRHEDRGHLVRRRPEGPGSGMSRKGKGFEHHYTLLSPETIVAYEARFRPRIQAAANERDRRLARLGKSVLAQAEGGQVRAFMLGVIAAEPKASAGRVRDLCEARFGEELTILAQGFPTRVPLPPLRTFQNFLAGLRTKEGVQP